MQTYESTGNYKNKAGENVQYPYSYVQYDEGDCDNAEVLSLANRQAKVDGNNKTRIKVQVANGDSTRVVLTEKQKLANKASRDADKAILAKLKAMSPAQLADLGL